MWWFRAGVCCREAVMLMIAGEGEVSQARVEERMRLNHGD